MDEETGLWRPLLAQAWQALALDAEVPPMPLPLAVEGPEGLLPARLPVQDTAIACVGTALLAAASLRKPTSVQLETRHIAAAMRSEAHSRRNGEAVGTGFAPMSRFWQAADGWVRTHANYPWHRDALLRSLAVPDGAALESAIKNLRAREVEDRVVAAGGVAAAVRSEAEWRAEAPGRAAADGLISGGRIGDAPARPLARGPLPVSGMRVLDLTRVIAGPVCTRFLAALGADVLRLDPPHRPELPGSHDSLLGKRSARLDATTSVGLARLHELLGQADVLVHGYRPGALDRFGLNSAELAERHPGLTVVSLSAWGTSGPWGDRRGFDSIVQAASGIAMTESPDGRRPGALPCQLLDHGTGYLCAAAALDARRRQAGEGGTHLRELSLARTALWLLDQPRTGDSCATPPGDVDDWLTTMDSDEGQITVVTPPGEIDGHNLQWPRRLTTYATDPAQW